MSGEEKFDIIVIGAGPAGSACAYTLAKEGKSILLVERGVSAGSKNMTGGRLYTYALEVVEPGLFERAPLQRKVVREQIMTLAEKSAITVDYMDYAFAEGVPQSFTVLRAPFDEWFAAEAEAQGAMVACGVLVDGILEERGRVVGIKAGNDEIRSDVVVAADGINSLIAQEAGLFDDLTPKQVGVGMKEVIELPEEVIRSRFNLTGDEGTARVILGCTGGMMGGGFLYTNKESLSLGIVFNPEEAGRQSKKLQEILQDLKTHPAMASLLEGGTTTEYSAHLVPELGLSGVPKRLFRDGLVVVGDAAGFAINSGISLRGMDLAILSGLAAARAIIGCRDVSAVGSAYMEELESLLLLPTMRFFAGWHRIMSIPRLYKEYPRMACQAMKFLFTVDGKVPQKVTKAMRGIARRHVSMARLAADLWKVVRAL